MRRTREFDLLPAKRQEALSGYHNCLGGSSWALSLHSYKTLVLQTGHHFWKEIHFSKSPDVIRRGCKPVPTDETRLPFDYVDHNGCEYAFLYRVMVENVAKHLHNVGFAGRVIFVTSPPGHTDCNDAQSPWTASKSKTMAEKFHWNEPMENEHRWREAFSTFAPEIPFTLLNITGLSQARSDAHPWGDCLHYCEPGGVPATWVDILLALAGKLRDCGADL